MHGGQNQVAGQGRIDGDFSGFSIAQLANNNDIGVVAQYRAQDMGKAQTNGGIDGNLIDAINLVFHRVLNRDQLAGRRIQPVEGTGERGGLA